ncbi:D-aminoacid aminotransferase-like PLP-dependent enzyme [Wolfiporia cocos MD-104 SS10]|uniref:Branched-chain-amino-acid aminotransferase n=1 Tax=Wolfiporia cocos (strain MD-104) TaxID=742152 RepID=A0A2H3JYP0_WOLCO|nr:D-aminoacid aminotransferase-like PLP-dependent enzyme [Wolfiporia cocos MD-104 SS10]
MFPGEHGGQTIDQITYVQSKPAPSAHLPDLDISKLIITPAASLKSVPPPETLKFGQTMTDHMLYATYHPETGCTNVFEGFRAYMGPDGKIRLFRQNMNVARLKRSVDRIALPPGGTGAYKLSLNYGPTLKPQQLAEQQGYNQTLWLLDETVTEAGAMNFFVVVKRGDGDWDVTTAPLDGTVLAGVTRDSCLALASAHQSCTVLPYVPENLRLHAHEQHLTMSDLTRWNPEGRLLEAFMVGTAVVVNGVGRIGYMDQDIILQEHEGGRGPVAHALFERILDIQEGRFEFEGWGYPLMTRKRRNI